MGRWGDGVTGRWGDGAMGRRGDGRQRGRPLALSPIRPLPKLASWSAGPLARVQQEHRAFAQQHGSQHMRRNEKHLDVGDVVGRAESHGDHVTGYKQRRRRAITAQ